MIRAIFSALWFATVASSQPMGASELLDNANGENRRWSGVGQFQNGGSCTAFLIRPPGAAGSSPAYVLSNGHCISTGSANEVIRDRALATTSRVTFHYFRDTVSRQLPVRALRVLHSTMKGYDLAIVELDSTLERLTAAGLEPLELSQDEPAANEPVWSVGVPVSNVPREEQFLRRSECTLGPQADLIEFFWHFWGSYSNDCSDIFGGSSGSPVVERRSGRVVAVMNTTTVGAAIDTGDFPCFNGQPCEVAPGGFRYRRDTSYAVPVTGLVRCFGSDGVFDLAREGCPLDPGAQLNLSSPPRAGKPGARWNATLSGELPYYRYKVAAEGLDDCRNDRGYGPPIALADSNRIADPLPEEPRRYYLCVLAGRSPQPGDTWQPARFATMVHFRVDNSPPSIPIQYLFFDFDESYQTQPLFVLPEFSNFRYKVAESAFDTCDLPANYRTYLRVPIRIPKNGTAYRVCYIGSDEAENETPPLELLLQGPRIFPPGVRNAASLRAGPIAPGSLATVFGVNLDLGDLVLIDAAGRRLSPEILYRAPDQINFRIPAGAARGEAVANESARFTIAATGPAIFNARLDQPVDRAFSIYVTGVAADATVLVSGVAVPTAIAGELVPGVTRLDVTLPADFKLRGFLPVTLRSGGEISPAVTMRFR